MLLRTYQVSDVLEWALVSIGAPYRVDGAERFPDRGSGHFLSLLAHWPLGNAFSRPEAVSGLIFWLRLLGLKLPAWDLDHLARRLALLAGSPADLLEFLQSIPAKRTQTVLLQWCDQCEQISKLPDAAPPSSVRAIFGDNHNLPHWLQGISYLHSFSDFSQLRAFLARWPTATDGDAVTLLSVHRSKGSDWPVVVVPFLEEGLFPYYEAHNPLDSTGMEEERRLFYVAVTRARQELRLHSSYDARFISFFRTSRDQAPDYDLLPGKASRFLYESLPSYSAKVALEFDKSLPVVGGTSVVQQYNTKLFGGSPSRASALLKAIRS